MPQEWLAAIVDGADRIIARTRRQEEFVGQARHPGFSAERHWVARLMDRQHGGRAAGARGLCAIGDRRLADSGRRAGRGDRAASLSIDRVAARHRRCRADRLGAACRIFRAEAGRAASRPRAAGRTSWTRRNRSADRVGDRRGVERVRRARASLDRAAPARNGAAAGGGRVALQPGPAGTRPGYLAGRYRRGNPARRVSLCQHDGGTDIARRARRAGRAAIPGHAVGAQNPGRRNAVRPAIAGRARLGRRAGDRNRARNVRLRPTIAASCCRSTPPR